MGAIQGGVDFSGMADRWPSTMVAREKVEDFTGGIMNRRYLANLDAKGEGPPRVRIGRKIAYPVIDFVAWLEARASIPKKKAKKGGCHVCAC